MRRGVTALWKECSASRQTSARPPCCVDRATLAALCLPLFRWPLGPFHLLSDRGNSGSSHRCWWSPATPPAATIRRGRGSAQRVEGPSHPVEYLTLGRPPDLQPLLCVAQNGVGAYGRVAF